MCATLEEVMAPELEARELKGKILAYAELGQSIEDIANKFSLSVESVKKIITQQ